MNGVRNYEHASIIKKSYVRRFLMKRKLLFFLALVLTCSLAIAGGRGEEATGEAAAKQVKITWSSVSVPNDAHTKAMQIFKLELERLGEGQIDVEVYHSGQLFTQEAAQAAVKRGTLDMVYTGPNWVAQHVPKWSMFAMPYVFESYDHMTNFFNSDAAKPLYDEVAQKTGMRPLGAFYLGTRQLNLRDVGREVRTPADMKGVKLRMPNSPTWQYMGECLGASPTPLSFTEVYMGLKTGTVDGQDNPLPTDKNAKFYEVTKYIILTHHYVNPVMPTINEKKWQSLGSDLQAKVMEALNVAGENCDKLNLDQEASLVDFFKKEGMTIVEPDVKPWVDFAQNKYLNDSAITKSWDMDLFKKIQGMAK
jgi:tripartite ATP-independent transporter DctP family solute receptor